MGGYCFSFVVGGGRVGRGRARLLPSVNGRLRHEWPFGKSEHGKPERLAADPRLTVDRLHHSNIDLLFFLGWMNEVRDPPNLTAASSASGGVKFAS